MVDEAHIGKCSWTAYEDETRRWNVNWVRKRVARHDENSRLHNGIANETDEQRRSRVPKGVSTYIARR